MAEGAAGSEGGDERGGGPAAGLPAEVGVEVLISYAPPDNALAFALENHLSGLKLEGAIRVWHSGKIPGGGDWRGAIDEHFASCRVIVALVSADYLASDAEMTRVLARRGEVRVIPVLVRPCEWKPTALGRLAALPTTGKPVTSWPNQDEAWAEVVRGIREALATLGATRDPEREERPFPGLEFFDEEDARFFFGRGAEVTEAVTLLGDKRWLQIDGPSGAGKSSLARAGVVPAVRNGRVAGAPGAWRVAVLRPGQDPLSSLAQGVREALEDVVPAAVSLNDVLDAFRGGSDTELGSFLREHTPKRHGFLLVIDQLEEAFTLAGEDKAALRRFDALLAAAVRDKGGPLYLVTTIRSDFVARFGELPRMEALLNPEAGRYYLKPMSAEGLRAAIEEPAKLAGLVWEGGLVERILEDAEASEGGLPLVAHVLGAVWAARTGDVLGHAAYDALGGVGGALAKSADAIVDGLGKDRRELARRLLLRLVKIGRGAEDTRQTARRREALQAAGGGEEAERVLARLSGGRDPDKPEAAGEAPARLVVVSGRDELLRVDLVHEALLRKWGTLRGWIDEGRKGLERRDDLEAAAQGWVAAGRPEDGLPGGAQLAYLRGAEAPGEQGREYLARAEAGERRRIRRERTVRAGLVSAVVVFGGMAAFAVWQRNVAERRLDDAITVARELGSAADDKLRPIAGAAEVRKELLDKTAELQERLLAGAGDSKSALRGRMANHTRRGDLARTHDDLVRARHEYEDALTIARRLAQQDPSNATYRQDLSVSYTRLGDVANAGGDLSAARGFFEKGLELRKALVEADPNNAVLLRELSVSYNQLGDVANAGGDLSAARGFFEKHLEISKALVEADPNNAGLRRDLSVSYNRLGAVAKAGGDLSAARGFFEKHLEIVNALSQADPQNADLQIELATNHLWLATVALQAKDTPTLHTHRDAAKYILDRLERDGRGEGNARIAKIHAELAELGD